MLSLGKYSFGVGDRFAHQAQAQLRACVLAAEQGVEVIPVWNKSHREHTTIGSQPASVRAAANSAVQALGWKKPYHVDADHIRLETVDGFIASSDFYTIDVADAIGRPAPAALVKAFAERHPELVGRLQVPGIESPLETTQAEVERCAGKFDRRVMLGLVLGSRELGLSPALLFQSELLFEFLLLLIALLRRVSTG